MVYGRFEIAQFLLDHGASPDASYNPGDILNGRDLTALLNYDTDRFCNRNPSKAPMVRSEEESYRDRVLGMFRQLLNIGCESPDPWFLALRGATEFEHRAKILLDHPDCTFEYELESLRSNAWVVTMFDLTGSSSEVPLQLYEKLAKKYQFDFRAKTEDGASLLHLYILHIAFFSKEVDISYNKVDILAHCTNMLKLGCDPCSETYHGVPVTFLPMLYSNESFTISMWFEALLGVGINIHKVARHAFRRLKPASFSYLVQEWEVGDETLRQACADLHSLQEYVLGQFARVGVYPDASWWEDNDQEEVKMSVSSIDYVPTTLHDPDRQSGVVRRREGHALESD